jgi:hypothetical protein
VRAYRMDLMVRACVWIELLSSGRQFKLLPSAKGKSSILDWTGLDSD